MNFVAPDPPTRRHTFSQLAVLIAAGVVWVVATAIGGVGWLVGFFALGVSFGFMLGWRRGWRTGFGAWERPQARNVAAFTEQVLAHSEDLGLDDEQKNAIRELHGYAAHRLEKIEKW